MEEILRQLLNRNRSLITRRDELINILDEKIPNNLRRDYAALRKALTLNVGEILAVGNDPLAQKKEKAIQILKDSGMQDSRIDDVINILVNVLELEETPNIEELPKVEETPEEIVGGRFIPMSSEPELPRKKYAHLTKSSSPNSNNPAKTEISESEPPEKYVSIQNSMKIEDDEIISESHDNRNLPSIYTAFQTVPPDNLDKIFSFEGRLNRWRYFTKSLKMLALMLVGGISSEFIPGVGPIIIFVASLGYILLSIRRLHDLDRNGFYLLLAVIPLMNFVLGLYLLFTKGTEGDNQYGEDPLLY